jgi:hypothetical protein
VRQKKDAHHNGNTAMSQRDHAACLESFERFLESSLSSVICEGLISIRSQADSITQTDTVSNLSAVEVTKQLLREVKSWTQLLLEEEARRIETIVPYLQKLLTALFVMKLKILSCINVRKNEDEFPLTIPANTTFIHQVYIQCTRLLVDNPGVLHDMSIVDLQPLVREGIRRACDASIKWNDFLVWGLEGVSMNDMVNSMNEGGEQGDEDSPGNSSGDGDDSAAMEEDNDESIEVSDPMSSANEPDDDEMHDLSNDEKSNTPDDDDDMSEVRGPSASDVQSLPDSNTSGDPSEPSEPDTGKDANTGEGGDANDDKRSTVSFF